jgi:FkbM family methyltransferase
MIALTNIRINRLEDKVLLINAGIGSSDKEVCADANDVHGYYIFRPGEKCDTKIRIYTLSSLIKELNIEEDSVLKIDCEGCEYDTILHTDPQDLKIFKEIIIEYHNGYHELKRFLEDTGFNTKIKPIRSFPQSIEKQGYLIAKRDIR